MLKRVLNSLLALGLVAGLFVAFPQKVYAIGNPTAINIGSALAFTDVLETGDFLFFVRYNVAYSPTPPELPEATFYTVLYNPAGTVILGSVPLHYYGNNINSVYFSAAQAATAGLVSGTAYLLRVSGSPLVFTPLIEGTNMATQALGPSSYHTKAEVPSLLLQQAQVLQVDLGVTLVTTGGLLNSTGTIYFLKAIPALGTIAPSMFITVASGVTAEYTNWTENVTAIMARRGPMLQGMVTSWADFLHTTYDWAAVWLALMTFLLFSIFLYPMLKDAKLATICAFPVLPFMAWAGMSEDLLRSIILIVLGLGVLFGVIFILGKFK